MNDADKIIKVLELFLKENSRTLVKKSLFIGTGLGVSHGITNRICDHLTEEILKEIEKEKTIVQRIKEGATKHKK